MITFKNKKILSDMEQIDEEYLESFCHIVDVIHEFLNLYEVDITIKFSNLVAPGEKYVCGLSEGVSNQKYLITMYPTTILLSSKHPEKVLRDLLKYTMHELKHVADNENYEWAPEDSALGFQKLVGPFMRILEWDADNDTCLMNQGRNVKQRKQVKKAMNVRSK